MVPAKSPLFWRIDKTWRFHRSVVLSAAAGDDRGLWATIDKAARVRSHDAVMSSFPMDALVFFPTDRWWTAIFMPEAEVDIHVDIATPCRFEGHTARTIDLDLDVVRRHSELAVLDEDEFEANRHAHAYNDHTVAAAQQAVSEVRKLIEASQFPFDGSSEQRQHELRRP